MKILGSILLLVAAVMLLLLATAFAWRTVDFNRRATLEFKVLSDADARTAHSLVEVTAAKSRPPSQFSAPTPAPASTSGGRSPSQIDTILSLHPELLNTYVKAARLDTEQTYGSVFAKLNLSADQVGRLESLIVNDLEYQLDLDATIESQKIPKDDPAIAMSRASEQAQLEADEQTLLGEDGYRAYDAAVRAQAMRPTADLVGYLTSFSQSPLSGAQASQLTQLLADSSKSYQNGKIPTTGSTDWDAAITKAQSFLSADQLETFKGVAQLSQFQDLARKFDREQNPVGQ